MALSVTTGAALRIKDFISKRGRGIGLRVGVKTTGCSGLAYKLEFVDQLNEDDVIFLSHDIQIIVDKKSLEYIDGTTLDYTKEGLQEGFKFTNPNVKAECGCGESFTV
jgi:iron-sulfur cluster assembly protein